MKRLLEFFTLSRRCDALERQIKLLTFYMSAEADFRRQAWEALQDGDTATAVQILASYEEAHRVLVAGSYTISVDKIPGDMHQHSAVDANGEGHAVYYRSPNTA